MFEVEINVEVDYAFLKFTKAFSHLTLYMYVPTIT